MNMKIKISFFSALMISSLLLTQKYYALIPLFVAFLHECGHLAVARIKRIKIQSLDLGIFGARINIDGGIYSYSDEILVCLGGPLVNLLCADAAAIIARQFGIRSDAVALFILSSLSLGIINLLPICSFDGGRILFGVIAKRRSLSFAEKILKISSFISLFLIWIISVYLLLKTSASLSLFVFSVSVFATIFM